MLIDTETASLLDDKDSDRDTRSHSVNEVSGIVYRCRLKDIRFLTLCPSFVFKLNGEWREVGRSVKSTERF